MADRYRIKTKPNGHDPDPVAVFVTQITASWQKGVESIIETGRLLLEAKAALRHGEWLNLFSPGAIGRRRFVTGNHTLPFSERTAQRLMAIARNPILSNPTHVSDLPASWSTLYALTELPVSELEELIKGGYVHSEVTRRDVNTLAREFGVLQLENVGKAIDIFEHFMRTYDPPELLDRLQLVENWPPFGDELDDLCQRLPTWIWHLLQLTRDRNDGPEATARRKPAEEPDWDDLEAVPRQEREPTGVLVRKNANGSA